MLATGSELNTSNLQYDMNGVGLKLLCEFEVYNGAKDKRRLCLEDNVSVVDERQYS